MNEVGDVEVTSDSGLPQGRRPLGSRIAILVAAAALVTLAIGWGIGLGGREPESDLWTVSQSVTLSQQPYLNVGRDAQLAPPTHVGIAALGVDAEVEVVTTNSDGVLEPPSNVSNLGWWAPGASPAGPGSTVITGHVDSRDQGKGALYDLREIPIGSSIEVSTDYGEFGYIVTSRTAYAKTDLPKDLFSVSGIRRLVLITCGGAFDADTGDYEENVVVTALPR